MPRQPKPVAPRYDDEECVAAKPIANADPFEDPSHPSRWKHRRRMAYTALISILFLTVYVMGPWMSLERLEKVSDIVEWFYFSMASIVGAYMGFATWASRPSKM